MRGRHAIWAVPTRHSAHVHDRDRDRPHAAPERPRRVRTDVRARSIDRGRGGRRACPIRGRGHQAAPARRSSSSRTWRYSLSGPRYRAGAGTDLSRSVSTGASLSTSRRRCDRAPRNRVSPTSSLISETLGTPQTTAASTTTDRADTNEISSHTESVLNPPVRIGNDATRPRDADPCFSAGLVRGPTGCDSPQET